LLFPAAAQHEHGSARRGYGSQRLITDVPIRASWLTRFASSALFSPSVPAGRIGSTM